MCIETITADGHIICMKNKDTLVVNFFGGPGTGKSTFCAGLFYKLKILGIDCEMSLEYAKDVVWEESYKKLDNQVYIFGKQQHKLNRLKGKVDVIITDSPLVISSIYCKEDNDSLHKLILNEFNKFKNINYFLSRFTEYNSNGRMQTLEEAKVIDEQILDFLLKNNIEKNIIKTDVSELDIIALHVLNIINNKKQ